MPVNDLCFGWWNVNDFYDFRPEAVKKGGRSRWPQSRAAYDEKCARVDRALSECFNVLSKPQVLCLGELTARAAAGLRDRLLPGYRLTSLDVKADEPTLQVAVLYAEDSTKMSFSEGKPIVVPRTHRATRPMAVVDAKVGEHTIRFITCHWQARMDEEGSKLLRMRTADHLAGYCYDFIHTEQSRNHVVIIGDFNEEPFEDNLNVLNAHRHRGRSQNRSHWTDKEVKRAHLYNLSWRLLGEQYPHPESEGAIAMQNCAGTYFWEQDRSWKHFDQIVVSGGLLESSHPHIDESEISIVSTPAFLTEGLPIKFEQDGAKFRGLSDHLPIFGKIHV